MTSLMEANPAPADSRFISINSNKNGGFTYAGVLNRET